MIRKLMSKKSSITSSYVVKLKQLRNVLNDTVDIYQKSVYFLLPVVQKYYDVVNTLQNKKAQRYIERLIHNTSKNKACYPSFDKKFDNFPSYYRRAAITDAIAYVKSFYELGNVQENQHFNYKPDVLPCFFKKNTFKPDEDNYYQIKIFKNNNWIWFRVKADASDMRYLNSKYTYKQLSAPRLIKRHHGWSLRFSVKQSSETKFRKDRDVTKVLGVDLGLNKDAVCSVVNINGTVDGSKFIDNPLQKGRLYHVLNVIKKSYQNSSYRTHRLYSYVRNYNYDIAVRTAKAIIDYAVANDVHVIVFENLSSLKPRGSKKQKIALWRRKDIQKRVEHMAKRYGIRVAYICPKNTSALAFDGSGFVTRGHKAGFKNNELCRFQNGKVYNCDLSASKNIAARYFLRVLQKSMSVKMWSHSLAKVPELCVRTSCTLSSLINLNAVRLCNA